MNMIFLTIFIICDIAIVFSTAYFLFKKQYERGYSDGIDYAIKYFNYFTENSINEKDMKERDDINDKSR